ncbi:MAG: LamG domain-containing protein [Candidatus Dormibacterales bacterium]
MISPRAAVTAFGLVLLCAVPACGGSSSSSEASPSPAAACPPSTKDAYAKAVLGDGAVAYYRLSDAAGTKLCDASPRKNDGLYNATGLTYQQPGALKGISDTALTADGTINPATSSGNTPVFGAVDFTLEAWFKTTSKQDQMVVDIGQGGTGRIAGIGPSTAKGGICGSLSDAVAFDTWDGYFTGDASSVGINVFDGAWHYIAGSFTQAGGGSVDLYLDGKLLATTKVSDQPATSQVRIGYWVDTFCNSPFAGSIDEVAIYPTALTAAQVKAHYTAAGR